MPEDIFKNTNKVIDLKMHKEMSSSLNSEVLRKTSHFTNGGTLLKSQSGGDDGGGGMNNFITRPEFDEHKRHLDSRFDGISKDITIAKIETIEKMEQTRKSDKRWFLGLMIPTLLTVAGIGLKIFGII